ncbi:oligopeptide/dipeptide ABC transporter ATP-binding protein [Psychrobium sp. 1_MG-2023]|uniref:peptide ABC transporter ATP-binding protein n=1 Tax=Psychrobium sp. 1_MG-2023 TaxID=3062624 RepID=UPI000C33C861|nr:oligopeptide/dipeptide ABC transporter ATP-binding protein [Psychrobium sp. 1_MG-2023]MDP2562431.1 ATP-binding cassette domain-containing protein [Psychrobium sp. 1_MG-2023]PKF56159.1 peptide ABC transporter ATP-binding protein [Alteromonadales bacterium alter-6D02]
MPLLDIRNLSIEFDSPHGRIKAVDRVNLSINPGEIRGLVGESGSGKSLVAKAIMGILNDRWYVSADRLRYNGVDLLSLSAKERRKLMGREIAMVFQEPSSSLDPNDTVGHQLHESLPMDECDVSFFKRRKWREERIKAFLHKVGIRDHKRVMKSYPHELSEGICQKVMIAMTIAYKPRLLIADEPTTVIEAGAQDQIFKLFKKLNQLNEVSILLITHDLEHVESWTKTITVMYCGQTVESGYTKQIFKQPYHPYTMALLQSMPHFNAQLSRKSQLTALSGSVPSLQHLPIGCRLGPRCPRAQKLCVEIPKMEKVRGHYFSCHFPLTEQEGKKS